MSLYLLLDLGSLSIPFLFSFHPKLRFDKEWKTVLPGIFISMVVFVIWDVWFTEIGVWGFNARYLQGTDLLNLPLEEWLFFICIPYACLFTHHCLNKLLPSVKPSERFSTSLSYGLALTLLVLAVVFMDRWYTCVNFLFGGLILLIVERLRPRTIQRFWFPYVVILVPFLLINGVLTGSFIQDQVVWYNDMENMGLRVFTIPAEDFIYGFSMLLFPLFISDLISNAPTEV